MILSTLLTVLLATALATIVFLNRSWLSEFWAGLATEAGARFFRKGTSKLKFVLTISNTSAPTQAEINAGTDLSDWETIRGFVINNTPIATPDGASPFTKSIPGADATAESGFRFYDDDASAVRRTALAKGTVGFVVLMPYGQAATKRAEVWRARSTGYNDVYESGNEAAKADVSFAIEEVPVQNAVQAA